MQFLYILDIHKYIIKYKFTLVMLELKERERETLLL